jgi:hypothetical protein
LKKLKIYLFQLLSITFLFLIASCSTEELEQYNPDFKGRWKSAVYYTSTVGDSVQNFLVVDGRDSGFGVACEKACEFCNCLTFQVGRARIKASTKELQIGGQVNQILEINQEPFINENDEWELEINQVAYFKYED